MDEQDDPVLQMRGVGKETWADVDCGRICPALRSTWCNDQADLSDRDQRER